MKLSELKKSEKAIIESIDDCPEVLRQRLASLGVQKGQEVICLHSSPVGGVTSFQVSHGVFALEDTLTNLIHVQKVMIP